MKLNSIQPHPLPNGKRFGILKKLGSKCFSIHTSSFFLFSACVLGYSVQPGLAEGSKELTANGGDRPFLEYRSAGNSQGITSGVLRRTVIKVFVNSGEELNLGSSAVGFDAGTINYRRPDGSSGTCGNIGRINDRPQEVAGPNPGSGGYTPCVVTVNQTGVWEIDFLSPDPDDPQNPSPIAADANWTQPHSGNALTGRSTVAAWDVTVRSSAGGPIIPGRVYANYLALNMGDNGRALNAKAVVLTRDGYQYSTDLNGLDPFGFIFFSNNKGFTDGPGGNPLYRSVEFTPSPNFKNPNDPDTTNDYTNKLFINTPNLDLPSDNIPTPNGPTWLLSAPVPPPTINNFRFEGTEGPTQGAAGTNPLTGRFTFSTSGNTPYILTLIIPGGTNRVFTGRTTSSGTNTINWDGLDGAGQKVPASNVPYRAELVTFVGEAHFPFLDPENNPLGFKFQRLINPGPGGDTIYYNDTALTGVGVGPTPLDATTGVPSSGGAHRWSGNFGNNRGIDTWVFTPSQPVVLEGGVTLREADLKITKGVSNNTPNPVAGGPISYTITVRNNNGPTNLVDPIPATVTDDFDSRIANINWTCTGSGGASCPANGTGNINTPVQLPSGGTVTFTVNGTIAAGASGQLSNTATVRRPNDVTDPVNDDQDTRNDNNRTETATVNVTIGAASADVVATKTGPTSVAPNGQITYNITVRNNGLSAATNVVIRDNLPPGVTFNSASDGGTESGGVVTFPAIANLASNTEVTRTITVTAPASGGPLTNRVSSTSDTPDPTPDNNNGSQPNAQVTTTITQAQPADVVATKTGPTSVAPNGQIAYNITVRNNGPNAATNVVVRDNLPPGVTFNSASDGGTESGGVVTFPAIANLASNTEVTRTITVTAPGSGGPFTNRVSSTSDTPDPTPNNNDGSQPNAQVTTTITQAQPADVVATKTGPSSVAPNGQIAYNITVRNNGPNAATNVVVRDNLPPGVTFNSASDGGTESGGVVTFPAIANLAPNTEVTRTITVTAPGSGGPFTNRVSSTSDTPDPTPNNNDGSQPNAQVTTTITQSAGADVIATKTGPSSVAPNGQISYNITVRNNGPSAATNVVVRDNLPPGVTFNSASDGGTESGGVVTFPAIANLAPNTEVTRTITVTAPASGGPLTNRVSSTSDTPDPTPNNNNGSQPNAQVTTTITQPTTPDLSITKTHTGNFTVGQQGTYQITVTNAANAAATTQPITLIDTLPNGLTFISASGTGSRGTSWTCTQTGQQQITCNNPDPLGPGQSTNLTITVNAVGAGSVTNQATVSTPGETNTQNNTATDPTTIVPGANRPPIANDDSASTNPGTPVNIPVLGNDSDPDNNLNPGTVSIISNPSNGTVTVNPGGTITYTPNPGFTSGTDTFVYQVCDTTGLCDTATVTVTVPGTASQPPVADDKVTPSTPNTTPVQVPPLTGNDPDGTVTSFTITTLPSPSQGTLLLNGQPVQAGQVLTPEQVSQLTFQPNPNFTGNATFNYTVTDNQGLTDATPATVTIPVTAAPQQPPVADDKITPSTPNTTPVQVPPLTGSDPDGTVVSFTITTLPDPSQGTLLLNGQPVQAGQVLTPEQVSQLIFRPNPNFTGNATFNYTTTDNQGLTDATPATVTIPVTAPQQPPVANNDNVGTNPGTPLTFNPLINDRSPDGTPLNPGSLTIISNPPNGTVTVNPDGTFTYTPNPGFTTGTDTFTYQICDVKGLCDTATVTVTVPTPATQPPVANNDSASTNPNTPVIINVLDNDTDPNNNLNPTTVTITANPTNGTVSVNPTSGQITYTPNPGFNNGTDTFNYQVCDTTGLCDTATVTVTVPVPATNPPVANNDSTSTNPNTPVLINVLANDSDPDNNLNPGSITIVSNPANGTVRINPDGTIVYTPNPGFNNGTDIFTYQVCDTTGLCDTATVTVTVPTQVPKPPVANDDNTSTNPGTPVLINVPGNDTDPDGNLDPTTVQVITPPANGTVTVNPGTGGIIYTPNPGFTTGTDTFNYQICDTSGLCDTATVTVTVPVAANTPPVANNDVAFTNPGTPVLINVLGNDSGSFNPSSVRIVSNPTRGTVTVNPDGTITYTPNPDFTSGTDTFTYEVCDTAGRCTTATLTVSVPRPSGNQTDVQVTQTGPTTPVPLGSNIGFNVQVTNNGPSVATGVIVTNPLPAGFTFVSATPTQGSCTLSGNIITCNLGDLNPGQTVNIPIVVTPTQPGTVNNTVTVTVGNDAIATNNTNTSPIQVLTGTPRLRLVKRITSITRQSVTTNFTNFVDNPADENDNAPGWSQLQPVGEIQPTLSGPLTSGDIVEYTIYFLSDGTVPAQNVNFCDAIPANTAFIRDSFGSQTGIQLNQAGTTSQLTNEQDSDIGGFFSSLAPLPNGNACLESSNPNGSVILNLRQISNTPGSNFGFVRFRVTID